MLVTDVILEWNAVMLEANANDHALAAPEQGGPVLTGRAFGIVSAAMYDAYNAIEHIGTPYMGKVAGASNANSHAAVAQAAHDTLAALFPSQQSYFELQLEETLSRIADGPAEDWGRIVGSYVATRMLAARTGDGIEFIDMSYDPSGDMGFHDVDPLNPLQGFYAPGVMDIAMFAMSDVSHFPARELDDGTPAGRMAFMQTPEYAAAYQELLDLGGDGIGTSTLRTAEQTTIAKFWGYDGRPGLGTPPRMYNQIARVIAEQQGNTEAENARMFALINIGQSDAGVASWNTKYDDAFWRPILGIRHGDFDGNPATIGQANWSPLGAPASNPRPGEINFTPPFPAYTSGHATFGAAAFQMLANFYGTDDIAFSFVSDEFNGQTLDADGTLRPVVERTFANLTEAKLENAQSRIYLGIHWRFDADEGIRQGNAIADYIYDAAMDGPYVTTLADFPWHHAAHPTNVDTIDDTKLADALLIISRLRTNNGDAVPLGPVLEGESGQVYYDVNADNLVTLNDALYVIAYLRHLLINGEGEALVLEEVDSTSGTNHKTTRAEIVTQSASEVDDALESDTQYRAKLLAASATESSAIAAKPLNKAADELSEELILSDAGEEEFAS